MHDALFMEKDSTSPGRRRISMSALQDDPKTVSNRIALHFSRARLDPAPVLHMNADALVIEYNSYDTGHKRWETISEVVKNNS